MKRFEDGPADVFVHDGGVDVGDLRALGEPVDDERLEGVGVGDANPVLAA